MELSGPARKYLEYHEMREARPRVACSDCQFEYVKEDGHTCDRTEAQAGEDQ